MHESTTFDTPSRGRVGSFGTLEGAAAATTHLVELEYHPRDVTITPSGYTVVEATPAWRRAAAAARTGAVIAAGALVVVAVVRTVGLGAIVGTLPAVALAALVGALAGAAVAFARIRFEAATTLLGTTEELRPTTFDVVVQRDATRAGHDLARWWDPAVVPVHRSDVA